MRIATLLLLTLTLALTGCATAAHQTGQRSSLIDYLYPNRAAPPPPADDITRLKLPVRVGMAFVPGTTWRNEALPEEERLKLLERVKAAFKQYNFIGRIETIPSLYLMPKGGIENMEQVARMFGVDVMVLISYDQLQFNDPNNLSLLYATVVGAMMIQGDEHDTRTLIDAAVFEVGSRRLLFRAPGVYTTHETSTALATESTQRQASMAGFEGAVGNMIPRLQSELERFKEKLKTMTLAAPDEDQPLIQVEHRPSYQASSGGGGGSGGAASPLALLAALVLIGLGRRRG